MNASRVVAGIRCLQTASRTRWHKERNSRRLRTFLLLAAMLGTLNGHAGVVTWTNVNGGLWSATTNWSPNALPAVADSVFLTNAGTYTVTQDVAATVGNLTVGGASGTQTVTLSAAWLSLSGASVVNPNGVLAQGMGDLAGSGSLTVSGIYRWSGGSLGIPVTVNAGGWLDIAAAAARGLSAGIANAGLVTWSGTGGITWSVNAAITNLTGAVFDLQGDQVMDNYNSPKVFYNLGLLRKSSGSGISAFAGVPLVNFGTVEVQTGTISHSANSQFNAGSQLLGAGTNLLASGLVTFNGTVTSENAVLGGAALSGTSTLVGLMRWSSGDLSSGAVLTIATNGTLNIVNGADRGLGGALINAGLVTWSGTNKITWSVLGSITNLSTGLFDLRSDQVMDNWNSPKVFHNQGLLRKSGGSGVSALVGLPLVNFGTVEVQTGTLSHSANSQFNDGSRLIGGGTNLLASGVVAFNGTVTSENAVLGGATLTGTSTMVGTLGWSSGELSSEAVLTVGTNGTLNIVAGLDRTLAGALINGGLVSWSGTNKITCWQKGTVTNLPGGLFDLKCDQVLDNYNSPKVFHNLGLLRKSGGSGYSALVSVPLINSGTVEVQTGTLVHSANSQFNDGSQLVGAGTNLLAAGVVTFTGTVTSENAVLGGATLTGTSTLAGALGWSSGDFSSGLALTIATNGTLNILPGLDRSFAGVLVNSGVVAWSGTNRITWWQNATMTNLAGGLFDLTGDQVMDKYNSYRSFCNLGRIRKSGGSGVSTFAEFPVVNSGTVEVQTGTLAFLGAYSQTGGRLQFGLAGPGDFGRLQFAQSLPCTGVLGVNLSGGFVPKAGDAFTLITHQGSTGAFTAFDLPTVAVWQTNGALYGPNAVTLTVLNARPVLAAIPARSGDEQTALAFTAGASDPDPGQTLTFSLAGQPGGAAVNPANGSFSWTPTEAQGPSTNTFTVLVADNGSPPLTNSQSVTVVVNEVNQAPALALPGPQSLYELTALTVTNLATDPDLPTNTLRFRLVSGPAGVNLDRNTGVLTWTPAEAQGPSTNRITIAVTDDGMPPLGTAGSFTVMVLESNSPPVLASIPDLAAVQDVPLLYTNSASDTDLPANALAFDLVTGPPGMKVDAASGVLSWTPQAGQIPSTNPVTVRVTDNGVPNLGDEQNFSVVAYPLPFLTITNLGTNVVLSWPAYAKGFVLQQTASLKPPVFWADLTNAAGLEGGMCRVTNRVDAAWRCYRLRFGAGVAQAPWLTIVRSNANVVVSWPVLAAGWSLYRTTNAFSSDCVWTQIPPPYQSNAAESFIREASPSGARFYRLQKP